MDEKGMIREHFDVYAPSWHDRLKDFPYSSRRQAVKRMLEGARPEAVVDVGCGTGDYAPLFNPEITRYVGIDISEKMIQHCTRLYPGYTFAVGDADKTGLPAQCADIVLSIAVLEYYDDPAPHMLELRRICRAGGTIVVAVPNGEDVSKSREEKIVKLLMPAIRLKHKLLGKRSAPPQSDKAGKVLHKRHTVKEMRVLGERFGMGLAEARFVNFQPVPRILDQHFHLNALWSQWVTSKGWEKVFRKSATILVCKFIRDKESQGDVAALSPRRNTGP